MKTETFFAQMWADYLHYAPSAERIHALLGDGAPITNDHIALRTFNTAQIGLEALEPLILDMGYRVGDHYRFVGKKLRAKDYRHADPQVPKIFLSELLLEECSPALREIVHAALAQIPAEAPRTADFLYSGRHWMPRHADYLKLLEESEYAAWLLALGFRANHFTVSVNALPGQPELARVNARLREAGFPLNTAGGEIKGGTAVGLAQSAILADRVAVPFAEGEQVIPACFYEFALRYPGPDGALFQGFVEASADKIFESTHSR